MVARGPREVYGVGDPAFKGMTKAKPTNESDHGRFRVFLALFIEILPAKGDQTPNLGVPFDGDHSMSR